MPLNHQKIRTLIISWSLERSSIFFAVLCIFTVALCATACTDDLDFAKESFSYSDLRYLAAIDADSPKNELLAIFTRSEFNQVQIRLDFLDVYPDWPIDIYLLFDISPGGSNLSPIKQQPIPEDYDWEVLAHIVSSGGELINAHGKTIRNAGLEIHYDSFLDTVEINFSRDVLAQAKIYRLLIITNSGEISNFYDVLDPIRSDAPPPSAVPVVLAFWDTFQCETPAQALRNWDGAHEGPDSSRHGLRHLVEAVKTNNTPIRIIGVNYSMAFVAFEYLGVQEKIEALMETGLLVFEEDDLYDNDYAHYRIIEDFSAATENGLSKSVVIRLLNQIDTDVTVILGGSLNNSYWGSPEKAAPTLNYIINHPWIRLVDYTTPREASYKLHTQNFYYQFLQAYNSIEPNRIRELAWSSYNSLAKKDGNDHDWTHTVYAQQIGHILTAAHWVNSPTPLADCSVDIDWDGDVECILATEELFTTYELSGGYLAFAFTLIEGKPHQIIGPSYQQSFVLGGRLLWDSEYGLLDDSVEVFGAFADPLHQWVSYNFQVHDNTLTMFTYNMAMRKIFTITDATIKMQAASSNFDCKYQIPFILDPWAIYQSDWVDQYSVENIDGQWQLSVTDEITIQVRSNHNIIASSFLIPREVIQLPEDPNFNYTPGYFLPFPMTILENSSSDQFTVVVQISKQLH